jgi:peptide/nickel transport system permease protein
MKSLRLPLLVLIALHAIIICAGFIAPSDPAAQNRDLSFAAPTKLHWRDESGKFHLRPFVYGLRTTADGETYSEDRAQRYSVRFFIRSKPEDGRIAKHHLFGVEQPGRIFVLGTDEFGRDLFSRIVHGGRVSIAAGLLATLIALCLGTALGAVAGMAGGLIDAGVMRLTELGLALSWFYLLLAVRAFLPLRTPPAQTLFLVAGVLGLTGWARPARLIRGVVLSAKERTFIMSARGFGASNLYIFRRHIIPQLLPLLLTQAMILIPQFIMAEVTLSFLGLGATEPLASWGNLLADLQQYRVLTSYWWMTAPVFALIVFSASYFLLVNSLQRRVRSVAV